MKPTSFAPETSTMRRALAVVLVVSAVIAAAWLVWPREPPDDEALIREAIAQVGRAATEKDVGAILEHVSESYRGEGGNRDGLRRYLLGYILRSDWVSAIPRVLQVEVDGDTANASLVVLLARGPVADPANVRPEGLVGSHYIESGWAREAGEWRVVTATRRDASTADWLN
jgi:hypothetical protein